VSVNQQAINATGFPGNFATWTIDGLSGCDRFSGAFYFKDLSYFATDIPSQNYKVYTIVDSPGTGYLTKCLYPSSPKAGNAFNVTVRVDTPAANNANITEYYPNTFSWPGAQVTLKKFKIGVGMTSSATLSVTPVPELTNLKFTITYDQASSILQSLAGDEYITMEYSLTAPTIAGEYTLPAAKIEYTIPLP
jgi:hypothetical protein